MADEKKKRSSTKIGGAWHGTTDEKKVDYISLKINEELLPFTITKEANITLWTREITEETHEKAPHYDVSISLKTQKED